MPAYVPPKTSFGKCLEHEWMMTEIDFALFMTSIMWGDGIEGGNHDTAAETLDWMIYKYSFWEVQTQETVDALDGICGALFDFYGGSLLDLYNEVAEDGDFEEEW